MLEMMVEAVIQTPVVWETQKVGTGIIKSFFREVHDFCKICRQWVTQIITVHDPKV